MGYAMLDFGFKAKRGRRRLIRIGCYAMLDFGFKAKLVHGTPSWSGSYAMLDFGFKAKLSLDGQSGRLVMPCLILDSRQNIF